jgi:DNA-binding beta-propeller fold protein YncE
MPHSIVFWILVAVRTATAAISAPACQSTAPTQSILNNVQTASLTGLDRPFGLVYATNDIAFTATIGSNGGSIDYGVIGVLNTSTFPPTLLHEITLPSVFPQPYVIEGLGISHDKRTVYRSMGPGAVAIDVEKAVAGRNDSVIGVLSGGTAGTSAIEATLSPDDEYVFISQEYGNNLTSFRGAVEVFNVRRAHNGSIESTYIGYIALGVNVVGTALSEDGSKLYAASETISNNATQGSLSVLDVDTLKTNPGDALLSSVDAGCGPVRVVVSKKHVWVTARESNMVLAFDASKLISDSANALVASVQVGTSPVGVAFVHEGRQLVTADSNRFELANATAGLTVVDVEEAVKGKQSGGFPRIPTGLFPREVAVRPNGDTMLVSDYFSRAVQAVNVSQLDVLVSG